MSLLYVVLFILWAALFGFTLGFRLWASFRHRVGLLVCQVGLNLTDGGMRVAQFGAGLVDRSDWLVSKHERGIPISEEE
jgi:hypothetical protein